MESRKKMILNPNCSSIVCRIPYYKNGKFDFPVDEDDNAEFITDTYPNGTIEHFTSVIKEMKKDGVKKMSDIPFPEFVDNLGGGGHWECIEVSWKLALLYGAGVFSEEKVMKMDDKSWSEGDHKEMFETCKICLEEKPDKKCENYVHRMVGECEGRFKQSLNEYIDIQYKKLQEESEDVSKEVDKSERN
jgi:hypothetical protein